MDDIWTKIVAVVGSVVGAFITAIGGIYMYDRNSTNNRISKVEKDNIQNRIDIKVIETRFIEFKEDMTEIKQSQKSIIDLLTRK